METINIYAKQYTIALCLITIIFYSCSHQSVTEEQVVSYVMKQQKKLNGQITGDQEHYIIHAMDDYKWLKAKLYKIKMPGLIHGEYYIVGVDSNQNIIDVYEPFTSSEPNFSEIVNVHSLVDSNAVLEFLNLLGEVYAANILRFELVKSPHLLSDFVNHDTKPLSIKKEATSLEIKFFVIIQGFYKTKADLYEGVITLDRVGGKISVNATPINSNNR